VEQTKNVLVYLFFRRFLFAEDFFNEIAGPGADVSIDAADIFTDDT
jgi:hypothetical protein